MRVLFDQNVPKALRRYLSEHEVTRARELGWEELTNGALLKVAEERGFDVLISSDQSLAYQQISRGERLLSSPCQRITGR